MSEAPEYDPEKPVDVLGDPTDYAAMPDLQLLAMPDDLDALLELARRYPTG